MMKWFVLLAFTVSLTGVGHACGMKNPQVSLSKLPEQVQVAHPAKPAVEQAPQAAEETVDVVDTAVQAGQFTTLAKALEAAGLIDTLKGEGPFTIFAPTDEAFSKLPAGQLENLLRPENKEQLIKVLTFHVVPGNVTAEEVVKLKSAPTVEGQPLSVQVLKDGVRINKTASVVKTDISASNGVIHVIDRVLLP
jgi:uncharacterized surface protein with fasciclin (FAS1) repeats